MSGEIERRDAGHDDSRNGYPPPSAPDRDGTEFVMVGRDVPAGKRLYASRHLKGTAFALAVDAHLNGEGWALDTIMQYALIITKPTYSECLAELMTIWRNWDNAGRELPAGRSGNGRALM